MIWQDEMEVEVGAHVLGIVGSLMRIWSPCSHHRATGMITWRQPIFQTPASSVICNPPPISLNAALTDAVYCSCSCGCAYLDNFRLSAKAYTHKAIRQRVRTNDHVHQPFSASSCKAHITGWAEVHRAGKHLAIIEPRGRPVNLFSALTWECAETYELLHNYM